MNAPHKLKRTGPVGAAWLRGGRWHWRCNGYFGSVAERDEIWPMMDIAENLAEPDEPAELCQ